MWILLLSASLAFADSSAISKSREIFLNRGRPEALLYLQKQIESPNGKSDLKTKLLAEGLNQAQRFLTDQAQRDYEMATSSRFSGGADSRNLYEKALKLEPDNADIIVSLALLDLVESKCSEAKTRIESLQSTWKFHPYLGYLKNLVRICDKEAPTLAELRAENTVPELKDYNLVLEIRILIANGRGAEAVQTARTLKESRPKYSEPLYWEYKAGQVESEGNLELLKKYISICEGYSETDRRSYRLDPNLCLNVADATQILKADEGSK